MAIRNAEAAFDTHGDSGAKGLSDAASKGGRRSSCTSSGRPVDLTALRAAIARIEGEPVARLDVPKPDAPSRDVVCARQSSCRDDTDRARARRSRPTLFPLGCDALDDALGGGFPAAGLAEIHLDEARDGGSLAGFALALASRFGASPERPLLWIADEASLSEAGLPYLPGLLCFGIDPEALYLVRAKRLADAAWAAEEAAASRALSVVILEIRGNPARLALEGTRRLHLRAREAGLPFLLLRQSATAEATSAPLRLRIRPGPASPVVDLAAEARLIGFPVFDVAVEKSRRGRAQQLFLEWNPHERRFDAIAAHRSAPLSRPFPATASDRPDPARDDGTLVALRA